MASSLDRIAEKAGVSRATVARILSGKEDYRRPFYRERAERIRAIAHDMNYRPNVAAKAISTGNFGAICVLGCDIKGSGVMSRFLLAGITDEAARHEQMVMLTRLSVEMLTDREALPVVLRSAAFDGLLVNYTHHVPSEFTDIIEEQRVPVLWLNNKRDHNCIYFKDYEALRDTTTRIIESGHSRIALLTSEAGDLYHEHYSTRDRLMGYRDAMRSAGLEPQVHSIFPSNLAGEENRGRTLVQTIESIFSREERPTAVIATHYANLVYAAARACDLDPPEDVTICALVRYPEEFSGIPVATLQLPDRQMGARAVEGLMSQMQKDAELSLDPIGLDIPLENTQFLQGPVGD
ncbi:MAG: LacI family DNA-binding transcriptional regulator [Candidatus Sumerlaeota bacterium]